MTAHDDIAKTYDLTDFVAKLRRLADALETGNDFHIEIDGQEFAVPGDVMLSVEHESEDGNVEIEFQLSWFDESQMDDDEDEEEDEEDEDAVEPETEVEAEVEAEEKPEDEKPKA